MRRIKISKKLKKTIKKLSEKDKIAYKSLIKKIEEIVNEKQIEKYKNLKSPLNMFKRVHVNSSFILLFSYNKNNDEIIFYDYEHHDKIYKKKKK